MTSFEDQILILTAGHVHRNVGDAPTGELLGAIQGVYLPLAGQVYRVDPESAQEADDPLDAALIHIQDAALADRLRPLAYAVVPENVRRYPRPGSSTLILGYRHRDAERTVGRTVDFRVRWWSGNAIATDSLTDYNLRADLHVGSHFDLADAVNSHGQTTRAPTPLGVSGAGIWAVESDGTPTLTGIFTEYRDKAGILFGTTLLAHAMVLRHRLPPLFNHERWDVVEDLQRLKGLAFLS